jgi:hypothetical protein
METTNDEPTARERHPHRRVAYIGQLPQARSIGRSSYSLHRHAVNLGGQRTEPRRTTSGSGDEGKPPATQEPLQLRPQVPNNDAPSEAELKYSEERFTADLGKLHSAWQFILSAISPQSIDIVKINDSYEKATKE